MMPHITTQILTKINTPQNIDFDGEVSVEEMPFELSTRPVSIKSLYIGRNLITMYTMYTMYTIFFFSKITETTLNGLLHKYDFFSVFCRDGKIFITFSLLS